MHDLLTVAHTARPVGLAIAAALMLAACQAHTDGTATPTPATGTAVASAPTVAAVDRGALDPGRYSTTPAAPQVSAGSEAAGRVVEGRRLAGAVVGPWQVDPTLSRIDSASASLITDSAQLSEILYATTTYKTPNLTSLVVGFTSERWAADPADDTRLRNAVLRFPDPDTATSVARGLQDGTANMTVRTDSTDPIPTEPIRPVPIPGHDGMSAALFTFLDGTRPVQEVILISAHESFVLVHNIRTTGDPARAADLAARTLDLQRAALDRFALTPVTQLADLPPDPTGLGARTVAASDPAAMRSGTYDPAGALHLETNPVAADTDYDDAGVEVVSPALTTVYQGRDDAAATELATRLLDPNAAPASGIPGLPDARCAQTTEARGAITRYRCTATAGQYAFTAASRDLTSAHHQIAAQYLLLTR